jgi:hypothetical protein
MATSRSWRQAVDGLAADIRAVVDTRLRSLVVFEAHGLLGDAGASPATPGEGDLRHDDHVHTLALVDGFGYDDLARLAPMAAGWQKRGLAVPLFLAPGELRRSLDAFPLEFSQIVARHVVVAGDDPFTEHQVAERDLRRACEAQVRSHLLHLREGFLETAGSPRGVSNLVAASAVPLRALLVNIARLHGVDAQSPDALTSFVEDRLHLDGKGLRPLLSSKGPNELRDRDAGATFPAYLRAVEQLATLVDEWTR